jgi:hypothetical protein
MSFIGKLVGKLTGAQAQADAAKAASETQMAYGQAGIDATRRQFDAIVKLMEPFVQGGTGAFQAQQNLLGLGGADAQKQAIQGIQQGPQFQAMQQAGQNAILQNASATGGLRGGNTQAALGQFDQQLLAQLIQQQYGNLGGLSQIGQASAAGQASASMNTGANIANLLQQQGAAGAGGQLAQGSVASSGFGSLLNIGGMLAGSGLLNGLGGGSGAGVVSGGTGLKVPGIGTPSGGSIYSLGGGKF